MAKQRVIKARLPAAPQGYDRDNEAMTRRIIELALIDAGLSGGAGLLPRYDVPFTTDELAPCEEQTGFLDMTHPTVTLIITTTDNPVRIRFYANENAATVDEDRPTWRAPDQGLGVLLDLVIKDTEAVVFYMSPAPHLYNGDDPVANGVWYRFKNIGEDTTAIAMVFTVVADEAAVE